MKYITIDGGTTNTRVTLVCDGKIFDSIKLNAGARACGDDKVAFENMLGQAISVILKRNLLAENNIDKILASGMITSEMGICPLEHIHIPAGIEELCQSKYETVIENVSEIPFVFIRGVKKEGEKVEDFDVMRGEETELVGAQKGEGECVYMLMGTHSKIIKTDSDGKIIDFCTMLTGEMAESISKNTVLKNSLVLCECDSDTEYLKMGYEYCRDKGLSEALFKVRVLKNFMNKSDNSVYSFFMGAILCGDVGYVLRENSSKVVVGGNKFIKKAIVTLLKEYSSADVREMTEEEVEHSTPCGIVKICERF